MKNPRNILITGGSSGIGESLALEYAAPGVFLALTGRDTARLEAVAEHCRQLGADVTASTIDVRDRAAMESWIKQLDVEQPLDLVIANAGVGFSTSGDKSLAGIAEATFAVNVGGVFHTIHPAIEAMKTRGQGQIAILSSIAGLVGMPGHPAYSASKNAVRAYGEAMRGDMRRHGIEVSVICPGYVESRMTAQNRFKMPFLMTPGKAARIIAKGLARNKPRIAFPWQTYYAVRFLTFLPNGLVTALLSKGPTK